jgi:hypothetical protein
VYALIALTGFGFGVWTGNQRPKPADTRPTDTAKAADTGKLADAPADAKPGGENKASNANANNPGPAEPKKTEPKKTEPKKTEPMGNPEPKKTEPKPDPKPDTPSPAGNSKLTFETDVKPILRRNCLTCHGDPTIKGGLDVRTLDKIKVGGDSGAAVIGGKLEASPLWDRIQDNSMPPKDSMKMLTPEEKQMIKDWILAGAKEK